MFRTINRRFYIIVGILILIFGISYTLLAVFLHGQDQNAISEQESVFLEREIRSIHALFFEVRFWERAILLREHPEAEKRFGEIMGRMRNRLRDLVRRKLTVDVRAKLEEISNTLNHYEKHFNRIIQLKTEQRLHVTRRDTTYRSLVSTVFRSNKANLLKPLFNLIHFQTGYNINRRKSEYLALKLVIDSLENKLARAKLLDDRSRSYVESFRHLLDEDFSLQAEIGNINAQFDVISAQLMGLFSQISMVAETRLKNEFQQSEGSRMLLKQSFIIVASLSLFVFLLVIKAMSQRVIGPIKSVARVMRDVNKGDMKARFHFSGGKEDEISELGWSLNDMLDTLESNKHQLVSYQSQLELKVSQLAIRERELQKHRDHLEELVEKRTTKLREVVVQLQAEVAQREGVEQELKRHKEDLEILIRERTSDLIRANKDLRQEIIERKKSEEERRRLETRLQQAKKMEAIGTLAGGVAHDLNNILSGIVSYPDLLLMDLPKDSPMRKPINTILASGQKAAAIVEDLLTLARRGVTANRVVNLNNIVDEYLKSPEHAKLFAVHYNVQLESNLEKPLLNVLGSPVHLSKTIMNLVSNAAEAMPDGGTITLTTENRYIDCPVKSYDYYDEVEEGDYVVLSVIDQGIGISPEDMDRIFEPFYTKKKMGRSGTGLGMAVIWGTVKDHGGYIDIESSGERGTTIRLYFPATREEPVKYWGRLSIQHYMGKGESILIVDDVKEQREIASSMLRKLGYSAISVSSGEEAIRYIKWNSVDLLLLDMIMVPGIDGLETYRRILEIRPGQKAVIASGFSETERVREAKRLGAGAYVKKPYIMERIGIAIRDELKKLRSL
jgi:signal transduction histidine kinase/ActR/RegA family two-component response regulator/HAMP domain-containing protein